MFTSKVKLCEWKVRFHSQYLMADNKLIVLIVDDSQLIVDKIIELLENCTVIGKIISCLSYSTAIELIEKEHPDVALLDINLPDKSGIDILSYIRQKNDSMKIIMFTNNVSDLHKDLCYKIGANHFIDKSWEFDKLSELISVPNVQSFHI